jgi:cytidyltransferase-like protein
MGKVIALVAGSFKPYTMGHHYLVSKAAETADQVLLFVSNRDRKRPGEFPIVWNGSMELVWKNYIEGILPPNVKVKYVATPIRSIYEYLIKVDEKGDSNNLYVIYSDAEDMATSFSNQDIKKYFPNLAKAKKIVLRAFERGIDSPDVSGTMLRSYIQKGDIQSFAKALPAGVQKNAKSIISLLKRGVK